MIPNSAIEIYHSSDGQTEIEVNFDNETVWLNQEQLSLLFERDRTVIGRHIRGIFNEEELVEKVVCADFAQTTQHGAIEGKTQEKALDLYATATAGKNNTNSILIMANSTHLE